MVTRQNSRYRLPRAVYPAVLVLALGIAYAAVALFDASFALGAFFAGMVLNESELSHRAAQDTLPLRDAFAVLFFVSVGMLFDPMVLINHPLGVLGVLAIIIIGKSAAALLLVRMFGHNRRTALTVAVSLAQIGEFAFILAGMGVTLEVLNRRANDLILAGAIVSIMLNPVLFTLLDRYLEKPKHRKSSRKKKRWKKSPGAGQYLRTYYYCRLWPRRCDAGG